MIAPLAVAGIAFCAWAVYLGGLAAVQELCENDRYPDTFALLDAGGGWACKRYLGLPWWLMCYQLLIIVAAVALARNIRAFHSALATAYGVGFVFFTYSADKFMANEKRPYWEDESPADARMNTLVAGCVMLAIVDGIAMFVMGMQGGMAHHDRAHGDKGVELPAPGPTAV